MNQPLKGIIPPLLTPMDPAGCPDLAALRKIVRRMVDVGVHGVWVNGTSGEFFALTKEQRQATVAAVVEEVGGAIPVVAQVGAPATAEVVQLAHEALAAGATHISAVAPYYADYTQAELVNHYRCVQRETGHPVVLYHLPQMTKVGLTIDSVIELAQAGVATAIKDSANDMIRFRTLVARAAAEAPNLGCFTGGSVVTDIGLFMGGAGAMPALANLVPSQHVAMYEAGAVGDWPRVRALQEELSPLIRALQLPSRGGTWTPIVAIYKHLLTERGLLPGVYAAPPVAPLSSEERAHLNRVALPLLEQLEPR